MPWYGGWQAPPSECCIWLSFLGLLSACLSDIDFLVLSWLKWLLFHSTEFPGCQRILHPVMESPNKHPQSPSYLLRDTFSTARGLSVYFQVPYNPWTPAGPTISLPCSLRLCSTFVVTVDWGKGGGQSWWWQCGPVRGPSCCGMHWYLSAVDRSNHYYHTHLKSDLRAPNFQSCSFVVLLVGEVSRPWLHADWYPTNSHLWNPAYGE